MEYEGEAFTWEEKSNVLYVFTTAPATFTAPNKKHVFLFRHYHDVDIILSGFGLPRTTSP